MEETKVALIGRNENSLVLGCMLEVKGIISTSQPKLHRCDHVMAMLCEQWSKGDRDTLIKIESSHVLLNDSFRALDPPHDFRRMLLIVAKRGLDLFFAQSKGSRSLSKRVTTKRISNYNPHGCPFVTNQGFFAHVRVGTSLMYRNVTLDQFVRLLHSFPRLWFSSSVFISFLPTIVFGNSGHNQVFLLGR
jgi:hypothetical protein